MKMQSSTTTTKLTWMFARISILILVTTLLAGCGSKVSGTYAGGSNAHFDQITFKSNGKADFTFMGTTSELPYEVDGKSVKIGTLVLQMEDGGILDGGGMIGKYYREGSDPKRMYGTYTDASGEKFKFKPDGHLMINTPDHMIFGVYTVSGSTLTITTERTFSLPSRKIVLKIVNQKTLDGGQGRQLHRQERAS